MLIALYHLISTFIVVKKLKHEREDLVMHENNDDDLFGIKMFMFDPYYYLIEYLVDRGHYKFITTSMCCTSIFFAIIEIVIFVIFKEFGLKEHNASDGVVFWFISFLITEACLFFIIMFLIFTSKFLMIGYSVMKQRTRLSKRTTNSQELRDLMKETDLNERSEGEENLDNKHATENNPKMKAIRERVAAAKDANIKTQVKEELMRDVPIDYIHKMGLSDV